MSDQEEEELPLGSGFLVSVLGGVPGDRSFRVLDPTIARFTDDHWDE